MNDDTVHIGEIKEKITYDYIINLYEEIQAKDLSKEEAEKQLAVLKVFADHIGEYMVIKYNDKQSKPKRSKRNR